MVSSYRGGRRSGDFGGLEKLLLVGEEGVVRDRMPMSSSSSSSTCDVPVNVDRSPSLRDAASASLFNRSLDSFTLVFVVPDTLNSPKISRTSRYFVVDFSSSSEKKGVGGYILDTSKKKKKKATYKKKLTAISVNTIRTTDGRYLSVFYSTGLLIIFIRLVDSFYMFTIMVCC